MSTNELLSRAIGIDAPPSVVLGVVGDPDAVPRWAPGFADRAQPAGGDRWTITSGGGEFEIRVRASQEAGTFDFLAPDEDRGLFARVVPNGEGSALVLTLVMPATTPPEVVEQQRAVLESELEGVRKLCEA